MYHGGLTTISQHEICATDAYHPCTHIINLHQCRNMLVPLLTYTTSFLLCNNDGPSRSHLPSFLPITMPTHKRTTSNSSAFAPPPWALALLHLPSPAPPPRQLPPHASLPALHHLCAEWLAHEAPLPRRHKHLPVRRRPSAKTSPISQTQHDLLHNSLFFSAAIPARPSPRCPPPLAHDMSPLATSLYGSHMSPLQIMPFLHVQNSPAARRALERLRAVAKRRGKRRGKRTAPQQSTHHDLTVSHVQP